MKKKYKRLGFTSAQSAELWERRKLGEGTKSIGRAVAADRGIAKTAI